MFKAWGLKNCMEKRRGVESLSLESKTKQNKTNRKWKLHSKSKISESSLGSGRSQYQLKVKDLKVCKTGGIFRKVPLLVKR